MTKDDKGCPGMTGMTREDHGCLPMTGMTRMTKDD